MSEAVYTEEYKGFTIEIIPDDSRDNPREWDNAGTMVCWHNNYTFGDNQPKISPDEFLADLLQGEIEYDSKEWNDVFDMNTSQLLENLEKYYVILPIYLYDHSVQSVSTRPFIGRAQHAEWDSGQIGWIYISKKDAVKEWGKVRYTSKIEEIAEGHLAGEVKVYDDYIRGNVYGYTISEDDDVLDGCWGYYPDADDKTGYDGCLKEARSSADWLAEERDRKEEVIERLSIVAMAHGIV